MDELSKIIEANVSDAIVEKEIKFTIDKREFSIKPPTIGKMQILSKYYLMLDKICIFPIVGKMQILSKYYLMLDIDEKALEEDPHVESMRVCESKADVVCRLMAVAVSNTKEDLLDDLKLDELSNYFKWNTEPCDFSTIMLALLTQVDYVNFISSIRLTKTLRQNKPKG